MIHAEPLFYIRSGQNTDTTNASAGIPTSAMIMSDPVLQCGPDLHPLATRLPPPYTEHADGGQDDVTTGQSTGQTPDGRHASEPPPSYSSIFS